MLRTRNTRGKVTKFWLRLFKGWIALSIGYISIKWIVQLVSPIRIRWVVIYPVDSFIQRFNNRGLAGRRKRFLVQKETSCLPFAVHLQCCNNITSVSDSSVYIVAEFPHCSIKTESAFYEFTSHLNPFTTSCFSSHFMKWRSRKIAVHCRSKMYQYVRLQTTSWKWS